MTFVDRLDAHPALAVILVALLVALVVIIGISVRALIKCRRCD